MSLSLLVPFAIYGLNLFNGLMLQCNDSSSSITHLSTNCVGEYNSSPYNWNVYAPREYSNPYYNFDDFGNSLFILFQIVSQEGWTDVMWQAMSSPGRGLQQIPYASEGNAVFFIVFNLLGAVFVLTLFVSVFMRNYTEQTGVAFLTADQRSWLELRKLLRQISPSKRPSDKPDQSWRTWCYRIAVKKHGKWQKTVTTVLCLHLVLLVLEWYPEPEWWEVTRGTLLRKGSRFGSLTVLDCLFLGFTGFYIANIAIRILGLTWKRFRRSSWDLYSILAVPGALITTILALTYRDSAAYAQGHKMLLVAIALLLIPRNNQLDQLFKTAAASLTTIGNLLATWFVLFLVFAIALTQTFGLTRFGQNENGNINFRTVPKALILLFRMSCGEGWNAIMEDFATITPPNCVVDEDFYNSDCGSAPWARFLFIAWNIVSMYIFVSMFVSLIFESFSYVYQRSSFSISRHEIRRFKEAWATQDREGTGFISKEAFPDLLRVSFSMRYSASSVLTHAGTLGRFRHAYLQRRALCREYLGSVPSRDSRACFSRPSGPRRRSGQTVGANQHDQRGQNPRAKAKAGSLLPGSRRIRRPGPRHQLHFLPHDPRPLQRHQRQQKPPARRVPAPESPAPARRGRSAPPRRRRLP